MNTSTYKTKNKIHSYCLPNVNCCAQKHHPGDFDIVEIEDDPAFLAPGRV